MPGRRRALNCRYDLQISRASPEEAGYTVLELVGGYREGRLGG
jgi:hypothetical protein